MATSIWSRKKDAVYLLFFVIHIPVMLFVDLTTLYPQIVFDVVPSVSTVRDFYIARFQDRLFTKPPAWFKVYLVMEALYHFPLSLWAIKALINVPLHLLVFALETAVTTTTCLAEMLSWQGYSYGQKLDLAQLYVPYLVFSLLLGLDMFTRIRSRMTLPRLKDA